MTRADGVVGPITWDRLMRESLGATAPPAIPAFPGSPVRMGASGEPVRQIQQAINTLVPLHPGRLWRLTENGIFDAMTRDAVFAIQSIFGLNIDGVVGPITWERLMREAAAVGQPLQLPSGVRILDDGSVLLPRPTARIAPLLGILLKKWDK